jgi:DNA-binding transcriptional MerR regulator
MKPILLEIVNRLSEMGASLGALEAALIHTRQLTDGDIKRLLDAHKANVESQLATLRREISALPE